MKRNRFRAFRLPSLARTIQVRRGADLWWQLAQALRELDALAAAADARCDHAVALQAKRDRLRVKRRIRTIQHEPQS